VRRILLGMAIGVLLSVLPARSHNLPGTVHNRRHAIIHAFCHSYHHCALGEQALNVAYCESGSNLWPWASDGEYLGMFQFGSFARSSYGFSWSPWEQARAAFRYWAVAGWSPWECA
jgi:hypothetical protein